MALSDLFSNVHLLLRWLHVLAGIAWIGLLYFFNFVNIPLQASLDDASKKIINPQLMPRALWWFRWSAMVTFVVGLALFTLNYMYTPGQGFGPSGLFLTPEGAITGRAVWILTGMAFGLMMWINVWFVIWPAQKKLLSGKAGDQAAAIRAKATKASRMNTFMSGPMLFGMLAPAHYGAANVVTIIAAIAIAMIVVQLAYAHSLKVSTKVA